MINLGGGGNGTLTVATPGATDSLTVNAPLQTNQRTSGALTKTGSGTLVLTAANTYTGMTTINGGTLIFSGAGTVPAANSIAVNSGGTLTFGRSDTWGNDGTTTSAAITVNAGGTLASGGWFNTLWNPTLNSGMVLLNGGALSNWPAFQFCGTLTATGTSTVVTGTGNYNKINLGGIGNGTLTVATPGATDSLTVNAPLQTNQKTTGALTKTGSGTLVLTAANTYTGATTINAGMLQIGNGGTTGSIPSGSAVSGSAGATLAFNRSDTVTIANTISGGLCVQQSGSGVTTLSASNSYSGGTTVRSGSLQVGNANALGTGGVTVNGGTLDLNGNNVSVAAFSGAGGSVTNMGSGTSTLTAAVVSGTSAYAGNIADGTGAVVLTKSGTGALILSGSLSMTGLNANGGVTQITQSGSIGAVSVAAGATLSMVAHSGSNYNVLNVSSLTVAGFTSSLAGANSDATAGASYTPVIAANQQNGAVLSDIGRALAQTAATSASEPTSPEAVPEPGTLGMLLAGALKMLGFRRKGKNDNRA